jgi:hypothetical protein
VRVKNCSVCGKPFDPTEPPATPAQEAGAFLGREIYRDSGEVCLDCLANRGTLGLMYCREFDG